MKNRILLENYYLPGQLEHSIGEFVEHYNNGRYHESLDNLTPADVYFGRAPAILKRRQAIKRKTIEQRRRLNAQTKIGTAQSVKPQAEGSVAGTLAAGSGVHANAFYSFVFCKFLGRSAMTMITRTLGRFWIFPLPLVLFAMTLTVALRTYLTWGVGTQSHNSGSKRIMRGPIQFYRSGDSRREQHRHSLGLAFVRR
jgi:putative transposase